MKNSTNKHPFIVVVGAMESPMQAFLVVDKHIVKEVEVSCLATLIAAYYVFNICYQRGLSNLFTFFEVLLLGMDTKRVAPYVSNCCVDNLHVINDFTV